MFEDGEVVFYENNQRNLPSHDNRPYTTASIREIVLKLAMLDPGSSLSIIFLSVLDVVGVSRDSITRQAIEVSEFGGNPT